MSEPRHTDSRSRLRRFFSADLVLHIHVPLWLVVFVVLGAVFLLAGCTSEPKSTSQKQGQAQTEDTFSRLAKADPYPRLDNSLERKNLSRKLLAENKPDQLAYVYLISFSKPMGYYTIKGKVSSNASQMTTSTFVERHADSGGGNLAYEAPGDDGSYGPNEPGVFFFTTEGTLVKTDLDYVYSTQPLPFNVPQLNK